MIHRRLLVKMPMLHLLLLLPLKGHSSTLVAILTQQPKLLALKIILQKLQLQVFHQQRPQVLMPRQQELQVLILLLHLQVVRHRIRCRT